ncbi:MULTISPECIES: TonB-dependent receptor [Parabacteroides]|uniref:SusC/RagA family TonB-linked outer membrane protein n=1 Tax=Parabacteroides leei TaxID=2939491 RepID=UPI00189700F7|nr:MULTISPECIES: TonB-dependent receptor [Parabacteroides]MCL3852261.1 TonB-dependent receptor [Parabacteroides leei]
MKKFRLVLFVLGCLCCIHIQAQQLEIKGIVTSSDDQLPLIGATVSVKGATERGVVTDVDGSYILNVEPTDKILVISYVGMKTTEVRVPKNGILNVALSSESLNLDEVVVTGYGNFSKSSFTGSANTLRADMLKNVPVLSVEQKLQGMTTGVNITSGSGQPGANQSIRIRGMGSFNASNEPLFVIDGVPVTSGNMGAGTGADAAYMNNAKTNIMSTLNPADIENITVIKDAAAASLYGSRAANGVILITTKKGGVGRTKVALRVSGGFSGAAVDFRPTLNGDQRREMIYEGLYNSAIDKGLESPSAYAEANIDMYAGIPEQGYTDWRNELLRTAHNQNYEVSASGGNERTTFYSSLGFNRQEGLVENSSLDRYSARLNVTQKVGSRGEIGGNMMFTQMNQEMNEERGSNINPFLCVAVSATPSMPVRDASGNYVGSYAGTNVNPLRDIRTDYNRSRMTRMFSTGYASVDIVKGLKLKETLSYDYTVQKDSRYLNPLSGAGPKSGSDAQTSKGFTEYGKLLSSTSINFTRTFAARHHLDVLAAYELESYQSDKAMGEKAKLPSDVLLEPDNAALLKSFASSTQAYRMISYLSRLNYDYDDRYYIAGSYRRDGSSRLAPESRWGDFWSVSGMWHLSNESFMKAVKPVLNDVKIRASYGVNGNQPGAFYGYMGLYSYGQNYMGAAGSYESAQANPGLKWEKNYNLNLGLDLSFINRIFVTLEYYNRDTKDLLYNRPISATTGFLNYLANIGQLNNKGVEFELRTINFATPDFNWTSVLNLTHNRNKIVTLDGDMKQSIEGSWFIHKVGLPYNSFYVKEFAGVDSQTGKALYYLNTQDEQGNYNREKTDDASKAEAIPYKSADPKIAGGFTNILSYKWFDLGLTFTYSLGGYSFDKTGTLIETDGSKEKSYNLPAYALDRWQSPGDITDVPRFVLEQGAGPQNSSRYIHSTDHIRLKNLTLGFTLPGQWTQKALIENARIYFSGTNLLTWAKWKQYDPEVPVNGEVFCEAPAMRTFNFGVEITF